MSLNESLRRARRQRNDKFYTQRSDIENELRHYTRHFRCNLFTMTPELGVGLSPQSRDYRLGWRFGLARSGSAPFELGIEATRRESANDNAAPETGVMLNLEARF